MAESESNYLALLEILRAAYDADNHALRIQATGETATDTKAEYLSDVEIFRNMYDSTDDTIRTVTVS